MDLLVAHARPAAHLHLAEGVWIPLVSLAALVVAAFLARRILRTRGRPALRR